MAVDVKNIFTGAPDQLTTGAINSAPEGTTLPTDVTTALTGFTDSGYVSEDGLTISTDQSFESIKDWSGAQVRRILNEYSNGVAWAHLELNEESLKNYLGDANVDITAATASSGTKLAGKFNAEEMPIKAWVFNMKDGPRKVRVVVPRGQVSERGEITMTKTSAITLPVTLTTFPDGQGNHIYIYTDDGVFSA